MAKKYDVYRFCKFRHAVTAATWLEVQGHWKVTVKDLETGEVGCSPPDVVIFESLRC